MNHSEFSDLLDRYRKGLATPEEIQKVEQWYRSMERIPAPIPSSEKQHRKERTLKHILDKKKTTFSPLPSPKKGILVRISIAASIAVLLSIPLPVSKNFLQQKEAPTSFASSEQNQQLYSNEGYDNRLIILDDGSTVSLTPGSSFLCNPGFGKEHRKTRLMGNGFFEIAHNPDLPFFVFCEEILTEVVGTSFQIASVPNSKSVEITVHTGKVSVFTPPPPVPRGEQPAKCKPTTLLPNQKAFFSASSGVDSIKNLIGTPEEPQLIPYIFDKQSLHTIFEHIGIDYGLDLSLNRDHLAACTFTGDLSGLTLVEKLEILRFSTNITYKITDSELIISGGECH